MKTADTVTLSRNGKLVDLSSLSGDSECIRRFDVSCIRLTSWLVQYSPAFTNYK